MIGTRIITKDRIPLQELLPLESPLVLFIDPADICNSKCSFCPTSDSKLMKDVERPLMRMPFNLFKKIIDDLQEFKTPIKVLRMYGHGEPLLNKDFCDMVKYAKYSNKIESIDTTSNGLLLNEKLNLELVESGLDRINISVNGVNAEQYLNFTKVKIDFDNFVANIKHLYENRKQLYIFIKINGDTISKEDEQKFLDTFENIADSVAIERAMNCWQGFEPKGFIHTDNDIGIYGQKITDEALCCPYIQYSITINSDGKVSLCFLDWDRKRIIRDVNKQSVKEIWESEVFQNYQMMMLQGHRKDIKFCKDCAQLKGGMPSNIDVYAEDILNKFKERYGYAN